MRMGVGVGVFGNSDLLTSCNEGATIAGSAIVGLAVGAIAGVTGVLAPIAGADEAAAGGAPAVIRCGAGMGAKLADPLCLALPGYIQYAPPPIAIAQTAMPVPRSGRFFNLSPKADSVDVSRGSLGLGGVEGVATPHALQNFAFGLLTALHL